METVKSGENDATLDEEPTAKRHRGDPYTKSVVVLFDGDVTVRENGEVYMPNTIEMAQLKKPGKGQFAKISFTSEMTERDVHKTLRFNFPLLSYKRRLSCASAVENRTRLEFHGNPRLWNGALINKFIRGNSALYLFAEGSCKSYKSQVLPSVFAASQDSVKPVSMASGSQHRQLINQTSEQDATWQQVPPAAAAAAAATAAHKNVSESLIIQKTASPSTEKLSVNERKRKRQSHDHNQQENVDLDQLLSDIMSSEDNLDTGYESTFPGENTDTEQSEDNVPVTRIIPPEGSTKGGQEFCVILPCLVPLHIQSCVAHFEGCGTVPLVADSLSTLTGITPGSKNPGLVNVTVMSKDESWMGGKTKFLYVDRFTREELLLQLLKESEMQSRMCDCMHKGITSDLQTSDPSGKALPGLSGVNHSRHAQSVKLLQFLVYKAAQIGGDEFIQMIFSTSAGRVVFNNYKNNAKLPEHVARANGHEILAEYLQDVNNRLSEESNSDAGTETIDWLELKRAVDKEENLPCTEEEQMLKNCQPPSPKSDYDGSDYLADDELSACLSPPHSELSDTEHEDHSQDTITYRSLKKEKEEKLQVESLFPLHFVANPLNVIPSIKAEEDAYEHKQLNSVEVESHSSEGNNDETAHDEIEVSINALKEFIRKKVLVSLKMASSIQKIDKATASINKGSDKKEEMKIMMAPYASWDQFLAPAPMSIALLGQLILVSAESDFSLQDKKNEIRFKLLKYPDSFRACLVQVSNKGWGAFNKAHTNMDQIRLNSGNVDGHVRTAVKFLLQGQPQEIEMMLPNALKSIENIADECVTLATSVEKEFVDVMELVAELLEACTRAKGQYEEDLKEMEIAIQVAQQNRKSIEHAQKEAEKKREEMMRQMKDAEKDYKEAMESVPSTGDLVGLAATEMLLGVVKSVSNVFTGGLANVHSGGGKKSSQLTGIFKALASDSSDSDSSKRYGAIQNALLLVGKIEIETAKIKKLATGNKSEGRKGPEWDNIEREARMINKKLENYIKRDIPKTASNKEQLTKLCTDGMKICETLLELKKSMNKDEEDVEEVMSRAEELSTAAETVSKGLKIALGGNTLENKSPRQAKQEIPQSQDDDGLVKSALQNARFKTESAKQNLNETRAIYEKSCQDVDEKMKQMGEVLAELAALQPKKIDLETIRKTLIKGIHALGELREQWGKLVKFFQMLSNLVKCCLQSSLKEFVSTSSMQMQLTERGMAMSDTMRDVLFEQAFKANQIAYVVNSISSVYVEVSDKHLMDRITCLGKLIALDPDQDRQEIMMKREELNQGCQEAQEAIKRIANQKKKEIEEAFDKRIGRIEHEVETLMPPMAEAEIKEIQEQVKTAMTVRKAAIEEELDDLV